MPRTVCSNCSFLLCGEGGVNWHCDTPCSMCHNPDCDFYFAPQYQDFLSVITVGPEGD